MEGKDKKICHQENRICHTQRRDKIVEYIFHFPAVQNFLL